VKITALDGGNMELCHSFETMAIIFYVLLPLFGPLRATIHAKVLNLLRNTNSVRAITLY
jgi:hypothetical protein